MTAAAGPDRTGVREQFLRLIDSLLDTFKPYGVALWLNSANGNLHGWEPKTLIARGEWEPLLAEAERLAGGPRG